MFMTNNKNLENVLDVKNRKQFRDWLQKNHSCKTECWVAVKHGKPVDKDNLYYLEAVLEALCFGWIDSVKKKINGIAYQRFSPRKKTSYWSELNKARCVMLKDLGLMTESGLKTIPDDNFKVDYEIISILKSDKKLLNNFMKFPNLYKRIRIYNIQIAKKNKDKSVFKKALNNFITQTIAGKMYGNWDDYGLLKKYENSFKFDLK